MTATATAQSLPVTQPQTANPQSPDVESQPDLPDAPEERLPSASAATQGAVRTTAVEVQSAGRPDPYEALASWQGTVGNVEGDSFTARLRSRGREMPVLDVRLSTREVTENDLPLLVDGAVFYWDVGYRNAPARRVRESRITFQRLPVWREADITRGERDADELARKLGWHL